MAGVNVKAGAQNDNSAIPMKRIMLDSVQNTGGKNTTSGRSLCERPVLPSPRGRIGRHARWCAGATNWVHQFVTTQRVVGRRPKRLRRETKVVDRRGDQNGLGASPPLGAKRGHTLAEALVSENHPKEPRGRNSCWRFCGGKNEKMVRTRRSSVAAVKIALPNEQQHITMEKPKSPKSLIAPQSKRPHSARRRNVALPRRGHSRAPNVGAGWSTSSCGGTTERAVSFNSSRTIMKCGGASTPIRTLFGESRTTVIVIESPI
jgi:hypothetical protein